MPRIRCGNDNHGRSVVTVRHCPTCGVILNESIRGGGCAVDKHARMRRSRSAYCMDCGVGLDPKKSTTPVGLRGWGRS